MDEYNSNVSANSDTLRATVAECMLGVSMSDVSNMQAAEHQNNEYLIQISYSVQVLGGQYDQYELAEQLTACIETGPSTSSTTTTSTMRGSTSTASSAAAITTSSNFFEQTDAAVIAGAKYRTAFLIHNTAADGTVEASSTFVSYFTSNMTTVYAPKYNAVYLETAEAEADVIISYSKKKDDGKRPLELAVGSLTAMVVLSFLIATGLAAVQYVRHFEELEKQQEQEEMNKLRGGDKDTRHSTGTAGGRGTSCEATNKSGPSFVDDGCSLEFPLGLVDVALGAPDSRINSRSLSLAAAPSFHSNGMTAGDAGDRSSGITKKKPTPS